MKVKLNIGSTSFITTATTAAKVAELLGDMVFVESKYWSTEARTGKDYRDPAFRNGNVEFQAPHPNKLVSMEQIVTGVFKDEAQADEWVRQQIEVMPASDETKVEEA